MTGGMIATVMTPIDLVKTRLQMEGIGTKVKSTGTIHMFQKIVKT